MRISTTAYTETSSYDVTISQASGIKEYEWVVVSDLTNLTEGTYVLASVKTSGTWKYMPSTASTGSNPTLGTLPTPSNNKLADTQVTDAMKWDLTSTGTDSEFYVRPAGSTTIGLGTTSSTGANIRISSSYKDTKWKFATSNSYNWEINNGTMWLSVYADTAWRNYKSNSTNQYGKFYLFKKVEK